MRATGLVVLVAVLGGCTSVKIVQRDGCWIRQTKKTLNGTKEEIGPCARPQPQWSQDRLTRLVQECVAQADYRWQVRALAAWARKERMAVAESQESVIRACADQAAASVVKETETLTARNETLAARLAEVSNDRETLRADATQLGTHVRDTNTKLAELLGEAAKQPAPVATATANATSEGKATTESGLTSETGSSSQSLPVASSPVGAPVLPAATPAPGPAPAEAAPAPARPARQARARTRPRPLVRTADAPGCEVPAARPGPSAPELAAHPPATPAPAASAAPAAPGEGGAPAPGAR